VENKVAFKKSTLISISAMFILILLSVLSVNSGLATSLALFPGVHVLIIYPIGRYRRRRQRRELKGLRYRRQYLLDKFVFSRNASEYFTVYGDEDSSVAQLGFVDSQC